MSLMSRDPSLIRKMGIELLSRELGPVGMAYFLRQFEMGEGDYTRERIELLKDITLDDIKREISAKKQVPRLDNP
jgi:hypothetical protein